MMLMFKPSHAREISGFEGATASGMADHKNGLNAPWHENVESTLMQMAKSYAILQNTIDLMLAGIRVQTRDLVVEGPDDDITPEEERLWHHCQGRRLEKHIKLLGRLVDCKVKADNQYMKVLRLVSYLRELSEQAVKAQGPHDRQSDLCPEIDAARNCQSEDAR